MRADGGDGARWVLRAVSLSGTRHRVAGSGPEDAYAWRVRGDDVVVAVADGVSNRSGSAATAAGAAEAAAHHAAAALDDAALHAAAALDDAAMHEAVALRAAAARQVVVGAVAAANDAATQAARRGEAGAATLVVALLDSSGAATLARVGDSGAFVLSGVAWEEVWPAEPDGPIRTATAALPSADPDPEVAEVALGPGRVLVVVTDGLADPLRDGPTTVAPGLAAGLAEPPHPLELARLVDFSRQGVHDDRTLVAAWPVLAPGGGR